jgi:hypothetical protein
MDKRSSKSSRYRLHLNNITFKLSNFRSKNVKMLYEWKRRVS